MSNADSTNGLMLAIEASMNWQSSIQDTQEITAGTVSLMTEKLNAVNMKLSKAYDDEMDKMPTNTSSDTFSAEMSGFTATLGEMQAQGQIVQNNWNNPMTAENSELSAEGSQAQNAISETSTINQIGIGTAGLLRSQLG